MAQGIRVLKSGSGTLSCWQPLLGAAVGETVGKPVGVTVGETVGEMVGEMDGPEVGEDVGEQVKPQHAIGQLRRTLSPQIGLQHWAVSQWSGNTSALQVGEPVGSGVGATVGSVVGAGVGERVSSQHVKLQMSAYGGGSSDPPVKLGSAEIRQASWTLHSVPTRSPPQSIQKF